MDKVITVMNTINLLSINIIPLKQATTEPQMIDNTWISIDLDIKIKLINTINQEIKLYI